MPAVQTTSSGDAEKKKAQPFFERARTMSEIGSYDHAIDLYIQGLGFHPDDLEAHKALREVAILRKAGGGKPMAKQDKKKLPTAADSKQEMLNAEKLLAYDPSNAEHMASFARHSNAGGFAATARWIEDVLRRAIA